MVSINNRSRDNYGEYIREIFSYNEDRKMETAREITFQVTNQCNLRCSYCYEHHKSDGSMSLYIGKKCIDRILDMYEDNNTDFINKNTKSIILDFIGGEPMLEAKLIEEICDYFFHQCYLRNIPIAQFTRIAFATNGQNWFDKDVQHFAHKYKEFLSITVSIDGIQDLHDKYRIDRYGEGSFEKAYKAFLDVKNIYGSANSKMTFVPNSVQYITPSIKMMIENGCNIVNCNFAYEPEYSISDAKNIYFELKKLSNYLIQTKSKATVALLDSDLGGAVNLQQDDKNFCGGTGHMMAFDPDGNAYPCIRYAPISIGKEKANKIIIGDCFNGLFKSESSKNIKKELDSITFTSQSPKKCIDCPVSLNCGWCSAYNYELYGTANKRYTGICYAHKGRVLGYYYYYNRRCIELGDRDPAKINLPYNEVVDILGKEEADYLFNLEKEAFNK